MNPWPMAFPKQACIVCLVPLDIAGSIAVEPDGRFAGFRHNDCEETA